MIPILLALASSTTSTPLMTLITNASLTTGIKLCLDAADPDSYSSGQVFADRSGNGYDFNRGATSGSEASDPTWLGESFSFDGGDCFTYDATNEAWMQTLHKDAATFSWLTSIYIPGSISGTNAIAGTGGIAIIGNPELSIGVNIAINSSRVPLISVVNASDTVLSKSGTALSASNWHIFGGSINENGGNASFFYSDGGYNQVSAANTFNASYTSPSSSNAAFTMQLGAIGTTNNNMSSGMKMGFFVMWQGSVLSKANFDTLYAVTKNRYGLS